MRSFFWITRSSWAILMTSLWITTLLLLLRTSEGEGARMRSSNHSRNRLRLPSHVLPRHYDLKLQPFLGINDTIDGHVAIQIVVLKPTSRIRIHLQRITIKPRGIKLVSDSLAERMVIRETKKESQKGMLTIRIRGRLQPGTNYSLTFDFISKLYHEPKGFYYTTYWKQDDRQRYVAATQFWTANAHRAFPCFDEPSLKATFEVSIARQEHLTALSNTPRSLSSPILGQPGWFWDKFEITPKMPTYLLAFVITEFSNITSENQSDSRVTVFARDDILERSGHVLEAAERSLEFFERYLGVALAVPKIDIVGLPLAAHNGMENWGLITLRESSLTYSPGESTADALLTSTELVVHELAHQWFGDLVTPSWWTDLWLSEGFATYMTSLALHEMFPKWKSLEHFVVSRLQKVMAHDSTPAANAVRTIVPDPNHMYNVFTSILYSKGASIIRMMKYFLSESTFKTGVANYLNKFQFNSAAQEDFLEVMNQAAHETGALIGDISLHLIMNTWTLQPGYPVLYVNRPDNSTATISQKHFQFDMSDATGEEDEYTDEDLRWWIPITFTDQRYPSFEHTRPRTWLRPQDDELSVTGLPSLDKWVVFNLQQTGYFRVNYDLGNWHLLLVQLLTDHTALPPTHRAQILDDALNLARAGVVPYHVALNMTRYLRQEGVQVPWQAAFSNFKYLHTMLRSSPIYGALKSYLEWVMRPTLESVALRGARDDDMTLRLLRTDLEEWACRLDLPECLDLVQELTAVLLDNSTNYLHSGQSRVGGVYCAAVRRGDERVWMSVWRLFSRTPHPDIREALGQALGCTTEMWLMNRFLSSGLRGGDLVDALRWSRQTDVGLEVAWQYVWNHRKILMRA
ncbi:Peptidase M1 membrane alanine aminopeptidase N-terminal [Trinorchestia longiramus]|nr:Peptidase M1 membrane alanine aminopeptidase N-terminal [Trinorchestia longiramus]